MGRTIEMVKTLRMEGLLLLLLCIAIASCTKNTGDPAKSIDYMKMENLLYADPAYLDSVEVGIVVNGVLSNNEVCWVGIWDLSQGYSSQPVWCDNQFYNRSCNLVFHPFLQSEGRFWLKAGLCVSYSDACVDSAATDREGPLTISVGTAYWPRVITIEYDCQRNYNVLSANTLTQLNAAFNPCSTAVKIVKDDTTLVDSVFANYVQLALYVLANQNTTFYKMYLLGIEDQSPRSASIGDSACATTLVPSTGNYGDPYGACVVFKRYIDSVFSRAPYSWDNATLNWDIRGRV
jgi:hypothetical protein